MGKLLDFVRDWLDMRRESRNYCKSCELLQRALEAETLEKRQLLQKFVYTEVSAPPITVNTPEPMLPKIVPWHIKRQMLEAEDREKAAAMRRHQEEVRIASQNKNKSPSNDSIQSNEISIEELEKELAIPE